MCALQCDSTPRCGGGDTGLQRIVRAVEVSSSQDDTYKCGPWQCSNSGVLAASASRGERGDRGLSHCTYAQNKAPNTELVDVLLESGASPGMKTRGGVRVNERGFAAPRCVCRAGDHQIAGKLLAAKADPEQAAHAMPRWRGLTPLAIAAAHGQLDVIALLLNQGPELCCIDFMTEVHEFSFSPIRYISPLRLAVYHGQADAVKLLLKMRASTQVSSLGLNIVQNLFTVLSQHSWTRMIVCQYGGSCCGEGSQAFVQGF